MERLRTALIGLTGVGEDYLTALRGDGRFDLIAVADTNPEVLRKHTENTSLRPYEDYRSLIVETAHAGLDVLFVALEPFQSIELVELAASRSISVFHKAPFARNVEEARRVLAHFDAGRCALLVERCWQEDPAFAGLENLAELIGSVHFATASVNTTHRPEGWRGDSARAGGGVLLNGAVEQVDMLTTLLGMPESVHALCSVAGAPGAVRKYDTEDAVTLSLRFKGRRIGSVTARRGASDPGWKVTLVGEAGTAELCEGRMTVNLGHRNSTAPVDGSETPTPHTLRRTTSAAAAISAVAAARLPGDQPWSSTADDHLKTLAVIEAAYLSAKTFAPETPARFLE